MQCCDLFLITQYLFQFKLYISIEHLVLSFLHGLLSGPQKIKAWLEVKFVLILITVEWEIPALHISANCTPEGTIITTEIKTPV